MVGECFSCPFYVEGIAMQNTTPFEQIVFNAILPGSFEEHIHGMGRAVVGTDDPSGDLGSSLEKLDQWLQNQPAVMLMVMDERQEFVAYGHTFRELRSAIEAAHTGRCPDSTLTCVITDQEEFS